MSFVNSLYFKVYFIKVLLSKFSFHYIYMDFLFLSLHFQPESLDLKQVSYRKYIYRCCVCIHSASLSFDWIICPFSFKVIIDRFALIAILLTVLGVYSSICSFFLLFTSLLIWRLSLMLCLDSFSSWEKEHIFYDSII